MMIVGPGRSNTKMAVWSQHLRGAPLPLFSAKNGQAKETSNPASCYLHRVTALASHSRPEMVRTETSRTMRSPASIILLFVEEAEKS